MTEPSNGTDPKELFEEALDAADRVGYDPQTETYHAYHNWADDGPIYLTVIEAVAAVVGAEPKTMEPLHSVLDPDAFDTVLDSSQNTDTQIDITYEGCVISVASSGEIVIDPDNRMDRGKSTWFRRCAYCEAPLEEGVKHPVYTETNQTGKLKLRSFCDEACQNTWLDDRKGSK